MDDISCSGSACYHWNIFNTPLSLNKIDENDNLSSIPDIINSGYSSPCPPSTDKHIYKTTLYDQDGKLLISQELGKYLLQEYDIISTSSSAKDAASKSY